MGTFKVKEDPLVFFQFIKDNISPRYQAQIEFILSNHEIFIRSGNEELLYILRLKFELTPQEDSEITKTLNKRWRYFVNEVSLTHLI